jgi:MFS family permease
VITLVMMGAATFVIGALPTHASIGILAPILLTLLRVVQGIGVGGEWGGSVLISMEWVTKGHRGLMARWPQLGVPMGLLLSTGMVKWVSSVTGPNFEQWGWRVPFLVSSVLVGIGLYVRLRVMESPEFSEVKTQQTVLKQPALDAVRRYPREILTSALIRMSEQAPFYLFITFVLTYGTDKLNMAKGELLNYTMIAAALGLISVPFFGHLSDRFGRRLIYASASSVRGCMPSRTSAY